MLFVINNIMNALFLSFQSYFEETMRVILFVAILALMLVTAFAAVEVSDNLRWSHWSKWQHKVVALK